MGATLEDRLMTDRRLLRIFLILVVALSVTITVVYALTSAGRVGALIGAILAGIGVSFFLTGIYSYRKYRGASLVPARRILRWTMKISAILTAVTGVVTIFAYLFFALPITADIPSPYVAVFAVLVIVLSLFLTFLLTILFGICAAFGVIGVMCAIERTIAPRVLMSIATMGDNRKLSFGDILIRWLFAIPDIIDTKLLDVHPAPKRGFLRWRDFTVPIEWQLLVGAVLALYISLNPFVAGNESITLTAVFSEMINGSVLIPFVILPWFALQRLGAGIGGAKKEFTLYNGIRARLLQTFFAVGTLLLLARVLISGTDLESFALGFLSFIGSLLLVSLTCTFVYLNYFENELVEDISSEYSASRHSNGGTRSRQDPR